MRATGSGATSPAAARTPAASRSSRGVMEGERRFGTFVVVQRLASRARRCSRRWRSRRAACAAGCGRGTTRTPRSRARPCSASRVTAKAVSSASTRAAASSGCSSPAPGAGSSRRRPRCPGSRSASPSRPHSSPSQRSESSRALGEIGSAERVGAREECLRQPGVVVAELVLEPAPVVRGAALVVRLGELRDEPFEQPARRRVEPIRVQTGEPEHRVRRRAEARLTGERADEPVEEIAGRPDDGRDPGGGEDVAERPDRPADMVADVRLVEPATVVAHEVAHPAVPGGRMEEGERAVEARRPELLVAALGKGEGDDGEPCDIVDAVAAVAVRDDPVGMLHDADVVHQRQQMVGAQAREVQLGDACGPPPGCERAGCLQHGGRRLGHGRPRERRADPPSLHLRRGQPLRLLQVAADRVGEGVGVVERHGAPGAGGEHVLCVPVGRRDDRTACGEREGQRAGGDLLAARVRCQEDVGLPREASRARRRRGTDRRRRRGFRARARRRDARAAGGSARPRDARCPDVCGRRSCRRRPDTARSPPGGPRSPSRSACRAR